MIRKLAKELYNKGFIPPILVKMINRNRRFWNSVDSYGNDINTLITAIEGDLENFDFNQYELSEKTIYFFAQPKSASLYITKLFGEAFNCKEYWIGLNKGSGEFYLPRVLGALYYDGLTLSHCHSAANRPVLYFLDKTRAKILVSYRNLADTIVSRRDMLLNDKWASEILSKEAISYYLDSSIEYQLDVIIDLFAPIYLNFYTGWRQAAINRKVYFIDYDNFVLNQLDTLEEMASFFNLPFNKQKSFEATKAIQRAGGVNFNKGVKNRGKELLNSRQKKILEELALKFQLKDSSYLGF